MRETDSTAMAPTGERMIPESADNGTFWEHIYRYRFATQFVAGKRVLDIASGEGYGLAALRMAGASDVIGVDISEEACAHARKKYNLNVKVGSGEAIPLETASVDVITSFETIEHVGSPATFLKECCRVLKPGGLIVISTPIRETYGAQNPNEFHISELSEEESIDLFNRFFKDAVFWAQRPHTFPSWRADIGKSDSLVLKIWKVWANFWARASVKLGRSSLLYNVARWRLQPVEAIQVPTRRTLLLDPFRIRPRQKFGYPGPQYLIAVATNRV